MTIDLLPERVRAKINEGDGGCWLWTAGQDDHGYGSVSVQGRMRKAHRVVYELLIGPIPAGLQLDHLCRVPLCVNPAHLEPVTAKENARRGLTGAHNKNKTHCPRGHEYADNAYSIPSRPNVRYCQACSRERSAEHRARMRQLVDLLNERGML